MMNPKYIFITGGVISGLGKGITAASIGNILKARGYTINLQKFDQYLNLDAGTLNPAEHGEVFVTDDGAETDLDLGHYERFCDISLSKTSSVMSGKIYQAIMEKERAGRFLGKTVQVIPHVTNEVKERIARAVEASGAEIHIIEIGGTVGDYEGFHFLEAIRQMKFDAGPHNVLYVHVGYVPYLPVTEELKSKPLQNSVHDLQGIGIQPDILIARHDADLVDGIVDKLALFTGVARAAIIPLPTVKSVYSVPKILADAKVDNLIIKHFGLKKHVHKNGAWDELMLRIEKSGSKKVRIAMVAKYLGMKDTYMSVIEALKAACWHYNHTLDLEWINSEELTPSTIDRLSEYSGILVPGGFGARGIEGKILAAGYARKKNIPYFGLCLGLQVAAIDMAREYISPHANSTEFDPKTPHPIVHIMPDQEKKMLKQEYGGTMRLGAYECVLKDGTISKKAYGATTIHERHRHRYEFNNEYRELLEKNGAVIAGTSPEGMLVEILEYKKHPWFVGVQFHPEFTSRPTRPHPLYLGFIKASINGH